MTETEIDNAERRVEELDKLMHDEVYKFLRVKMHQERDGEEIIRLNLLIEIRREQVLRK